MDAAVNRGNPLLRPIRSVAQVHEFRLPSVRDMPGWVRQRADKLGAAIEPNAVSALVDAIGNDTRLVDSELRKLALYRSDGRIRRQDVEAMVSYVREANIFAAVDAALEGRAGVALRSVHQLMDRGQTAQLCHHDVGASGAISHRRQGYEGARHFGRTKSVVSCPYAAIRSPRRCSRKGDLQPSDL